MTKYTKFSQANTLITCLVCGKRTWSTKGEGGGLCGGCYEAAGLENEHLDGHHGGLDGEPEGECPMCAVRATAYIGG